MSGQFLCLHSTIIYDRSMKLKTVAVFLVIIISTRSCLLFINYRLAGKNAVLVSANVDIHYITIMNLLKNEMF